MEKKSWRSAAVSAGRYGAAAAKWLGLSAVLGCLCGALGAWFHRAVELAAGLREEHLWLLWLLPVGGLVTAGLYRLCRVSFDAGTNLIITSVSTNEAVPPLLAPLIVVGTTLSHLLGASVGREGAALQLGGAVGHNLAKAARLPEEDVRECAMCGMSACFAAMFGTPLTACVFVVEVIRVGRMRYHALLPCLCAAYCAHLTALGMGAEPLRFGPGEMPGLSWATLGRTALLAAACAVVGIALCVSLEGAAHGAKKYMGPYLRIALGGAVMAGAVALLGLYDYAGAGTEMIRQAVAGQTVPWAFLVKLGLTALCVAAGFRGGEIVPTLFVGATFGCWAAPLVGLEAGFGARVGMIALFCSAVNCPMASICLAAELFSTGSLGLFAVAAAVAFVLSGYFSLYASQTHAGSKVRE